MPDLMAIGRFQRLLLVPAHIPAPAVKVVMELAQDERPVHMAPVGRMVSLVTCLFCFGVVDEDNVMGHTRFHAEQEHTAFWGYVVE